MDGNALKGRNVEATFFFLGFSSINETVSGFGAGGVGGVGATGAASGLAPRVPVAAFERAVDFGAGDSTGVLGVVERGVRVAIQYLLREEKGGKFREKYSRG
jgi:hypothetical protein